MKHYFIINPVAGQGKGADVVKSKIRNAMKGRDDEYEIFVTESQGHARDKARELAEALNGEEARFYAAGGDGTVHEVVNGVYGFSNIAVGSIPIGTGNDIMRNFPDDADFMDIVSQLDGIVKPIDLIEYKGKVDGEDVTEYCVNMINIGFDCNVVELAGRLKKKPLIAGSFAYLLSVFTKFIKREGTSLIITENLGDSFMSKEVLREGEMLLCAVCNGSYCGGGIKSAPMAIIDDGIFELNIINKVSRTTFLRLFPSFRKGEHMGLPGVDEIIDVRKCKDVTIEPYEKYEFFICVDGEIKTTTGIRVKMKSGALKFIVPKERTKSEIAMEDIKIKPKYNM